MEEKKLRKFFVDAFKEVVLPSFDFLQEQINEINTELKAHTEILDEHTNALDRIERKLDKHDDRLDNHGKRIASLENASA